MSADKTYEWEQKKFPWHFRVLIKPEHRWFVATELAKRFGIKDLRVQLDHRGGGLAYVMERRIRLPSSKYRCSLGLMLHEIAHVYDWTRYEGNGHRASFKKAMIKLCVEVRVMRMLPPIYARIREDRAQMLGRIMAQNDRSQRAMLTAQRAVDRAKALKVQKKTPEYRLERARARAKALRTRIKRLQTALKKAERQERALGRRLSPPVSVPAGTDTGAALVHHE
jgi:hypothetical protein